ncbi:ABC-type transport auxiliary lipoprotein family protein [Terrihabitans rhizophilus]|uniref:ABC-type transport auxiliary lipoprotein family protein n=1 Tax=Terrihabitans rhizophilus TaxID=3092662 RepID=A0ABU4RTT4_9HYPH|nr:ABC-type transport auxiliary lipoprotein family protein [Terrihabitans sp. PJ23]MDX6807045.1 ABC-type transport auxiliary lipoprotein family protein [Terrihabitans sp. PJ23]
MLTGFTQVSARRTFVLGLALLVGGCAGFGKTAPSTTFDLSAPPSLSVERAARRGVLAVEVPSAIQVLDSNRIVVRTGSQVSYLPASQWTDTLPGLLQTRIVQAFENSGRMGSVTRSQDRVASDLTLLTEIRAFEVSASGTTGTALVEISARLVDREGRVRSARVFQGQAPVTSITGAGATHGLNAALWQVLGDLVTWGSAGA